MAVSKQSIQEERILDLRNHELYYLSLTSDYNNNPVLLLDNNNIANFENIIGQRDVIVQISVAKNCLISLKGVSNFRNLCVLNLSNNFIPKIEDLFELKNITWLNLSGNQIRTIENLDQNVSLEHLDLSYNCIQILGNLSHLLKLKSLLLHGNLISSLKSKVSYFPVNLSTLSFAENEIIDIKQISQLSFLSHLEQLSVMGNPCARNMNNTKYKNYILSCCRNLKVLDGLIIQNADNHVEKTTHSISILNNICHTKETQPYLNNMSPESMINEVKTDENCVIFPYSTFEKEQPMKKDLFDDKREKSSSISNVLYSSTKPNDNSITELIPPHYSNMQSISSLKEITPIETWQKFESKYEAYDNRPVKALNKNAYKIISDTSYLNCSTPQLSMKKPLISNKKMLPPEKFISKAFDCDESSRQEMDITCNTKELETFPDDTKNVWPINSMPATTTTTDSAFASESNFYDSLCIHRAATQIQAAWRGFQCRNLNPKTKYAYLELRCMRSQQHITKLSLDLKQQRDICEHKNDLLKQFLEIVQLMWKELQLRNNIKQDDFFCKCCNSCKNCSSEHLPTFNMQVENLQKTCDILSMQVKHLHETLHTFMMGKILCYPENNADHPELHLEPGGPNLLATAVDTGYWSYVLQDQVNQNELKDFKDSFPYVSVPDCLTLLPLSENSIMLSWSRSTIPKIDANIAHTILGYKIYINDHPMAFIPANKTQLIVSNLHTNLTYEIYVTSVSTLQESRSSPRLIANYYMKNAAKERNICQSTDNPNKSILEDTQNNSKIISKRKYFKDDVCFNSSDYNTKLEYKKPTVAEVVEQRFRECSKNVSLCEGGGISQAQNYEHLKTKSKSLDNMTDFHVNEVKHMNCLSSGKHQKQSVLISSDEEDYKLEEAENKFGRKENKSGRKEKNLILLSLLKKLYSFSILKKLQNVPTTNLSYGFEELEKLKRKQLSSTTKHNVNCSTGNVLHNLPNPVRDKI